MKLTVVLAFLLAGCSSTTPITQEGEDFLTMVKASHLNWSHEGIVQAVVMQWTPEVVEAISNYRMRQEHWNEKQRDDYAQDLIEEHAGSMGDSTTFLISLTNTQFPCQSPILVTPKGMKDLIPHSMMPCEEISLDSMRIYLQNERGVRLPAITVAGKRHEILTTDEILFAKFQIGNASYNWFGHSQEIYLIIDVKPETIRLKVK